MTINRYKCEHDACKRERAIGSKYCDECIQLPAKECNFCDGGLPENEGMRKIAGEIQRNIDRRNRINKIVMILLAIGLISTLAILIYVLVTVGAFE